MKTLLFILLAQQGGEWSGMIMILAMVVIFYFFMIRPQSKKQKELKLAREAMKKGDKVITAGGIHGRIKEIKDNIFSVEIAPGVVIKIDKTSVFAAVGAPVKASEQDRKKGSRKDSEEADVVEAEDVTDDAGDDLEKAAGKVTKK